MTQPQLTDDPIAALERELVHAAERQARAGAQALTPGPPRPTSPRPPRRWTRHLGLPATLAAVVIPVLLVAGVLLLTRGAAPGTPSAPAGSRHGQPPTLVGELAILRRPPYPSDRIGQPGPQILHSVEIERADPGASIIPSLERHVVVQVPDEHPLTVNVTVLGGLANPRAQQVLISGVTFVRGRARSFIQLPATAHDLAAQGEITALGDGFIAALLPDGVAALRAYGASGPPVTARVHENVTGMRLPRRATTLLWLDRRGAVIRRLPLVTPAPRAPTAARAPPRSPGRSG